MDWTGRDWTRLHCGEPLAMNGVSPGNRFTQLPFETTAIDVTDELAYCIWYRGSTSRAALHREIRLGGGQRAQLQRLSCSSASVSGPRSHCTIHVPCDTFSGVYRCISGCNRKISVRGPCKIRWRPTRNRAGRRGGVLSSPVQSCPVLRSEHLVTFG